MTAYTFYPAEEAPKGLRELPIVNHLHHSQSLRQACLNVFNG